MLDLNSVPVCADGTPSDQRIPNVVLVGGVAVSKLSKEEIAERQELRRQQSLAVREETFRDAQRILLTEVREIEPLDE